MFTMYVCCISFVLIGGGGGVLKRTVILINCVPFRNRYVLKEINSSLLEVYSASVKSYQFLNFDILEKI